MMTRTIDATLERIKGEFLAKNLFFFFVFRLPETYDIAKYQTWIAHEIAKGKNNIPPEEQLHIIRHERIFIIGGSTRKAIKRVKKEAKPLNSRKRPVAVGKLFQFVVRRRRERNGLTYEYMMVRLKGKTRFAPYSKPLAVFKEELDEIPLPPGGLLDDGQNGDPITSDPHQSLSAHHQAAGS